YPLCGKEYGHPSSLEGTKEEVIAAAKALEAKGVDGIDLLSYRYTGDPVKLLTEVVKAVDIPVVSAGSIDTNERIMEVVGTGASGMTMGSALFAEKFKKGGSFKENLEVVCDYMASH
ncbi:MAG: nitronate monooxygenase, partial [Blautia sp.]